MSHTRPPHTGPSPTPAGPAARPAHTEQQRLNLPHPLAPAIARQAWALRLLDIPAAELDWLRYAVTLDGSHGTSQLGLQPQYSVRDAIDAVLRAGVFDGESEAAPRH